ncbi:hypothetical protein D9M69_677130 [compost metagenome]
MGKQRVVLEHHANAALLGRHVVLAVAHGLAFERDAAAAGALQPGHGAQQRGLAAARGADQHADVASAQAQRHAVHRRLRLVGVVHTQLRDVQEHGTYCR